MGWRDIHLAHIDTPALLIDRDKVEGNIIKAIHHAGGLDRLRPHVKTHKILEVAQMQLAAGIDKFKCATIAEAEMLGMAGARDVLMAYQPQGPKIKRVKALIQQYAETHYNVLLDNIGTAEAMQAIFKEETQPLHVYIDVNDGHYRTGIIPEEVEDLVDRCQELPGIRIVGLHCYDGHIRMPSLEERVAESTTAFKEVIALKESLEQRFGLHLNMVAGGSPSFSVHARHHDVECSPGTWIFWDERYANDYQELPFEKAAVVATRVISKLDSHTYCLDLGHKSIASEFPFPRVKLLTDTELTQTGHSEEHLIVKSSDPDVLEVGELLLGYPYHICPTVALYDHVHVVSEGQVIDQWRVIARDRKITI